MIHIKMLNQKKEEKISKNVYQIILCAIREEKFSGNFFFQCQYDKRNDSNQIPRVDWIPTETHSVP